MRKGSSKKRNSLAEGVCSNKQSEMFF